MREIEFFWDLQARNNARDAEKGYVQHPRRFWDADQRELFGTAQMSAGIAFDKYDDIQVNRRGQQTETVIESFADLKSKYNIHDIYANNLNMCKYSTPTPVQKHAMPAGIEQHDVLCCAQTGSGKTLLAEPSYAFTRFSERAQN